MIKKTIQVLLMLLLAFGSLSCVVSRPRYAPPPPPRDIVKVHKPNANYVWVPGRHVWRNGRYVWVSGYWVKERRGHYWVEGHWENRGGRWVWVKGYWRRR